MKICYKTKIFEKPINIEKLQYAIDHDAINDTFHVVVLDTKKEDIHLFLKNDTLIISIDNRQLAFDTDAKEFDDFNINLADGVLSIERKEKQEKELKFQWN